MVDFWDILESNVEQRSSIAFVSSSRGARSQSLTWDVPPNTTSYRRGNTNVKESSF